VTVSKKPFDYLLKGDADADLCVFEKIFPIDPDNFAGLDTCKLPFFSGQNLRSREIQLYEMARPDGCRNRQRNENAGLADVTASADDEPVGLRYPDANGPGNTAPAVFSLLN
jgi:hypothetical protein